jgi:hypothetical protein
MKKKDTDKEFYYFGLRNPEKIYVSKAFPSFHYKGVITTEKRYVRKVFEKDQNSEFVDVDGEIILKETLNEKIQVTAIVYSRKDVNLMEFTLQRFIKDEDNNLKPVRESSFSFSQSEFLKLLQFLSDLKFIDFSDKERFTVEGKSLPFRKIVFNLSRPDPNKVLVDKDLAETLKELDDLSPADRQTFLETLKNKVLTKSDLDILSGRKSGLDEFKINMESPTAIEEPEWQDFFMRNSWIFGYGLDYKFLSILQKEASVSSIDLDGKNEVKSDFLLATKNFTVLVELKRPDTPLFEKAKNRSESWRLSKDLTYAVSQILAQKAEWQINSESKTFDKDGNQIEQETIDPRTILIIGNSNQYSGKTKEDLIKKKTFELYRRNSRNIEIMTYDELFERAKFIVNENDDNSTESTDDDLPF